MGWATVIISLNEDMIGGATSFPHLGLHFPQKAGRALAWWNMEPNTGACDVNTMHVAEPVVSGHKMILMRWYRYMPTWNLLRLRPIPPDIPERQPFQPLVTCDVELQ